MSRGVLLLINSVSYPFKKVRQMNKQVMLLELIPWVFSAHEEHGHINCRHCRGKCCGGGECTCRCCFSGASVFRTWASGRTSGLTWTNLYILLIITRTCANTCEVSWLAWCNTSTVNVFVVVLLIRYWLIVYYHKIELKTKQKFRLINNPLLTLNKICIGFQMLTLKCWAKWRITTSTSRWTTGLTGAIGETLV